MAWCSVGMLGLRVPPLVYVTSQTQAGVAAIPQPDIAPAAVAAVAPTVDDAIDATQLEAPTCAVRIFNACIVHDHMLEYDFRTLHNDECVCVCDMCVWVWCVCVALRCAMACRMCASTVWFNAVLARSYTLRMTCAVRPTYTHTCARVRMLIG